MTLIPRYSTKDPGRITSVKVVTEPEWDAETRAWALALDRYEQQLGPCGHYLPRSTAPEAEGAYEVPPPTRCHECTAIAQVSRAYGEKSPDVSALLFGAVYKPRRPAGEPERR